MYLSALINGAARDFEGAAATKAISLRAELADDLPHVLADETRVRQIINNLMENAIKFTSQGGAIRLLAQRDPANTDFVRVTVADSGCGISQHGVQKIFTRLHQERSAIGESRQGLGLGLYICKELVVRQQGRIWAESTLGRGSTFHFALPIVSAT